MTPGQAPATQAFSLSSLDVFKSGGGFPSDYPANVRRFYSPYDQVHAAFKALVASATESLLCSMYGFDDPELAAISSFRDALGSAPTICLAMAGRFMRIPSLCPRMLYAPLWGQEDLENIHSRPHLQGSPCRHPFPRIQ